MISSVSDGLNSAPLIALIALAVLVGWGAVVMRWALGVLRERRLPRGGWIMWLSVGLIAWTGLGVLVITRLDFKHFLLLLGIQVLASGAVLACVDAVVVFGTPRLTAEIRALRPDIYCKAGDYTLEKLNGEERTALEDAGAQIEFLPFLPGFSTTDLIKRIRNAGEV